MIYNQVSVIYYGIDNVMMEYELFLGVFSEPYGKTWRHG